MKGVISLVTFIIAASALGQLGSPPSRYFHTGDGRLKIASNENGASFDGAYRNADGTYDEEALKRIHEVFSAKYGEPASSVSLRLVEFVDFIEDSLRPGATITIVDGFRSPNRTKMLRRKGAPAAKASMHHYGMAADLRMSAVPPKRIWHFVRSLGFGGAGFYNGSSVHVDVGPARFWDERTSKVYTDAADDNKLIGIVADKDIYYPGEEIEMRFIRMTAFPIGVDPALVLERRQGEDDWQRLVEFRPKSGGAAASGCPQFWGIEQMLGIGWSLPANLPPGRYRVSASFCNRKWEKMPEGVATPEFEIRKR